MEDLLTSLEPSAEPAKGEKKKKKKKKSISYDQELIRKAIHLLSLSIPILYTYMNRDVGLIILLPLALIATTIDVLSKKNKTVREFMIRYFGKMLRPHERKKNNVALNGASWVLISACLCVYIFPKIIAITAFTILIISDISAALIGRRWGTTPFYDKSLEGSLAFLVTAFIVVFFIGFAGMQHHSYLAAGVVGAIVGCYIEANSKRMYVDDNLSIPITIGAVMWGIDIIYRQINMGFLGY